MGRIAIGNRLADLAQRQGARRRRGPAVGYRRSSRPMRDDEEGPDSVGLSPALRAWQQAERSGVGPTPVPRLPASATMPLRRRRTAMGQGGRAGTRLMVHDARSSASPAAGCTCVRRATLPISRRRIHERQHLGGERGGIRLEPT